MTSILSDLKNYWCHGTDSPELAKAQHQTLMRQVPLMYAVMLVNVATQAILFHGKAPFILSGTVPLLVASVFIYRAIVLYRARNREFTHAQILQHFRTILMFGVIMSIVLIMGKVERILVNEAKS